MSAAALVTTDWASAGDAIRTMVLLAAPDAIQAAGASRAGVLLELVPSEGAVVRRGPHVIDLSRAGRTLQVVEDLSVELAAGMPIPSSGQLRIGLIVPGDDAMFRLIALEVAVGVPAAPGLTRRDLERQLSFERVRNAQLHAQLLEIQRASPAILHAAARVIAAAAEGRPPSQTSSDGLTASLKAVVDHVMRVAQPTPPEETGEP